MHRRTERATATAERLTPEMERKLWAKFDIVTTRMESTLKAMDDLFDTAFRR